MIGCLPHAESFLTTHGIICYTTCCIVLIVSAYKFRLSPTFAQRERLWGCCEQARRAWNWTVALCEREYVTALAEAGLIDLEEFTSAKKARHRVAMLARAGAQARESGIKLQRPAINRGRLYRAWCDMRDGTANSIRQYHSHVYSYPIERVVKAYMAFWKRKAHGAPRPHGPAHTSSFTIQMTRRSWERGRINIPGVGWVATQWKNRGQCGEDPLQRIPEGKPCSITVSRTANHWYASITVRDIEHNPLPGTGVVGIDLGMAHLLTTSDGTEIGAPRPLEKALRRLARLQRRLQRKPKRSRRRTLLGIQVAQLHARVAAIRNAYLHATTTMLARRYETIVVEGFDVKDLVAERVEFRATRRGMMDLGWGELRRQLEYKLGRRGGKLLVAPALHPTNRQCHACWLRGTISLNDCPPSQRLYRCSTCGTRVTRQQNTALLLESFGRGHWPPEGTGVQPGPDARGGSESVASGGADPLKREHTPSRIGGRMSPDPAI